MTSTTTADSRASQSATRRQHLQTASQAARYSLAREWLDAGCKEIIGQAVRDRTWPLNGAGR